MPKIIWVKKEVDNKEWDYIKDISAYYKLSSEGMGRGAKKTVAFCVADNIPEGCEEITDIEELRLIDLHRRQVNQRPFPLIKEQEKLQ
jgi:hypothetical protein